MKPSTITRISPASYLAYLDDLYEALLLLSEQEDPDLMVNEAGQLIAQVLVEMYALIRSYEFSSDESCTPFKELLETLEDSYQHFNKGEAYA